jgi:5-methylcytosine-specific restriction protein A
VSYPTFRKTTQAPAPRFQVQGPKRRDAELNSKWSRAAAAYLRHHPLCAECARRGRDEWAKLVDHIIPRSQGGSLWDKGNWQGLCIQCHADKRDLERLAIQSGDLRLLLDWMRKPHTRPEGYAYVATPVEDEDAEAYHR